MSAALKTLASSLAEGLQYDWQFNARPDQLLSLDQKTDSGDEWLTHLILAGRGWGKTRVGAETIRELVCGSTPLGPGKYKQVALVGETAADVRDVMVGDGKGPGEGSGLLQVCPKDFRPIYESSKRRLTFPNGAIATCYNATEPDQLRGPNHDLGWLDEICKFRQPQAVWDQYSFGIRLGQRPLTILTTTPRPIPLLKQIMSDRYTIVTRGRTLDNAANLAKPFLEKLMVRYEGTRLGRQELEAEVLDDVPGALWSSEMFEVPGFRVKKFALPEMERLVVAVDPSGTSGGDDDRADDVGIVVTGKGTDGRGYVLADLTCHLSPAGWGRRAVEAYHRFEADRIVAECNYGGAMVEHVIRTCGDNISYKEVSASRGKVARAEPIAALYEQGRVSHVAGLDLLEDEMCLMASGGFLGGGSPNRVDALVWGLTEVMTGVDRPILIFV